MAGRPISTALRQVASMSPRGASQENCLCTWRSAGGAMGQGYRSEAVSARRLPPGRSRLRLDLGRQVLLDPPWVRMDVDRPQRAVARVDEPVHRGGGDDRDLAGADVRRRAVDPGPGLAVQEDEDLGVGMPV